MRRIALTALLAATLAAPAEATHDRTDPIPASVGPADTRSYWVNTTGLPASVSADRWVDIARRSLERWGATYLGTTTTLSPDDHQDGHNVLGFTTEDLGPNVVGLNTKWKGGTLRTPGASTSCAAAPNVGTTQTVAQVPSLVKLRLRSDRVRKGKARKRTVTVRRAIERPRIDSAPLVGRRCVDVVPGTESDPFSVYNESDVQLDATLAGWFDGPGAPPENGLDLETVLLHELGHAAGLGHQEPQCDPSTPMRASGGGGEYWRGLDEVLYTDCAQPYPVTPDAPHGAEAPFAGGSLGGRAFHVNPAVPAGYDSARFVELARSIIERWGGAYAGTTEAKPTQGDGLNVIGFDTIARTQFEVTNRTSEERLAIPAYRACAIATGNVTTYRVKKATKKVRVKGRRKKLKVRRDKVARATVSGPVGQCVDHPAETRVTGALESDIGIAHEMDAYELGPAHPVLATRVDMPTLLTNALGRAAGIAPAPCGAPETPVTSALMPGEWWHAPGDVKRVPCAPGSSASRSPKPGTSGPVRYVEAQA